MAAAFALLAAASSRVENPYLIHLLILACIFSVLVMSHNLVTGYTGLFHLCHAAFYGIGAYTSALLALRLHVPVPLAFLLGAAAAALSGLIVGLLSIRLGGHYLAIVTLGFGVIVTQVLTNWESLTRGPIGLGGIPAPPAIALPGFEVTWTPHAYLVAGLALVFGAYLVFARVRDSKIGLMMEAIRENELAAACVGVRAIQVKLVAFTLAALAAGAAGGMYAHYARFLVPDLFSFLESTSLIAMTVLGGLGSFAGSIASACFFTVVPEMLRVAGEWRLVLYGGLLVVVVLFYRGGLAGFARAVAAGLARAGRPRPAPPRGTRDAGGVA